MHSKVPLLAATPLQLIPLLHTRRHCSQPEHSHTTWFTRRGDCSRRLDSRGNIPQKQLITVCQSLRIARFRSIISSSSNSRSIISHRHISSSRRNVNYGLSLFFAHPIRPQISHFPTHFSLLRTST